MKEEYWIEPTSEVKEFFEKNNVSKYETIYQDDPKEGISGKKIWKVKVGKEWYRFEQDFDYRYFE